MNHRDARAKAAIAIDRAYQLLSPQEVSRYRVNRELYIRVLTELFLELGDLTGKRVLDVGAGRGTLAIAIRFAGAEVIALEKYVFDHSTSDMFKEGGEERLLEMWRSHGITPLLEDLFDMDRVVPSSSIDGVVSVEVIEHLKEPKRFLEQIRRALIPRGVVVIATPNYGRLHARLRLLFGKNPKEDIESFFQFGQDGFIGHWREYLPSELVAMLRCADFEQIRAATFCDPLYAFKKCLSPYSVKQTLIHLISYLVPNARYEAMVVGRKKSA